MEFPGPGIEHHHFFSFLFHSFSLFLWLHLQHMEVPGSEIEPELQLWQHGSFSPLQGGWGWKPHFCRKPCRYRWILTPLCHGENSTLPCLLFWESGLKLSCCPWTDFQGATRLGVGRESLVWGCSQGVSSVDKPSRQVILEAFAEFEHFTCIRFVDYEGQRDFISIVPMSG